MHIYRTGQDVTVLNDHLEVPGIGFIPANAYVLHARQPVVVDTGLGLPDRDFVRALAPVIDPADVRWIWLTHPDRDHTGGLFELLDAAPLARVVTTFLGAGIMATERPRWHAPGSTQRVSPHHRGHRKQQPPGQQPSVCTRLSLSGDPVLPSQAGSTARASQACDRASRRWQRLPRALPSRPGAPQRGAPAQYPPSVHADVPDPAHKLESTASRSRNE